MALSARDFRKIIEIIDVIHSIPDSNAMFREVCEKLQRFIGIHSGIFASIDSKTGAFHLGGVEVHHVYDGVLTLYLNHFAALDPLRPPHNNWGDTHPNVSFRNTDLVPEKNLQRTEFACEFLFPLAKIFYILAATLGVQGDIVGIVGFHRQRHTRDFSDRDKEIVNFLIPHMAKTIHKRFLLNRIDLTKKPDGLIGIGEDNRPFFINDAAKQLLKGVPVESIPDPGLNSGPVFYRSKSGTYRVRTMPLRRNGKGKVILLERYPPEHRLQPELADPPLSRREKEIAVLVIQGHSNREIAALSFISEQTVKDHLHSIFEKLEVRSRGELTAKVLGLRTGQRGSQYPE